MFEQDYLMRMIFQLMNALRRSMDRAGGEEDPEGAARLLDTALGDATDLDGAALLSLAPESLAGVLQVSGIDPHITEYLARSLWLSARYYGDAGNTALAELRAQQAEAVAAAYGHDLTAEDASDEALEQLLTASNGEA